MAGGAHPHEMGNVEGLTEILNNHERRITQLEHGQPSQPELPIEPPEADAWPGYGHGADARDAERTEVQLQDGDWRSLIDVGAEENMRVIVPAGGQFLAPASSKGQALQLGENTKIVCPPHDALMRNISLKHPLGERTVFEGFTIDLEGVTNRYVDAIDVADDDAADLFVIAYCTILPAPDMGASFWSAARRGEGPGRGTLYRVYWPAGRHPANEQTRQHGMLAGAKEADGGTNTRLTVWESLFEQQMRVPKASATATIHMHRSIVQRWTFDASHVKEHANLKITSSAHDGQWSNASQRTKAMIRQAPGNLDVSDQRWLNGASFNGDTSRNIRKGDAVSVPYPYGTGVLTDREIEEIRAGAG